MTGKCIAPTYDPPLFSAEERYFAGWLRDAGYAESTATGIVWTIRRIFNEARDRGVDLVEVVEQTPKQRTRTQKRWALSLFSIFTGNLILLARLTAGRGLRLRKPRLAWKPQPPPIAGGPPPSQRSPLSETTSSESKRYADD